MEDQKVTGLAYTTCSICGKKYFRPPGTIYKLTIDGKLLNCCSYHCFNEAKKLKSNHTRGKI